MSIVRVFPRRTKQTPTDDGARFDVPGLFDNPEKALISVTFTWDKPRAEYLADAWGAITDVEIGGPAYGDPGGNFEPGKFLRRGYVITSRGCPNKCWFCYVWRRSGGLRELPITDGWIIQDDNLLACSEQHIKAVFEMLKRQPKKAEFAGGLEAAILQDWHVDLLADLKPAKMFFAYDTLDDYDPLRIAAGKLLQTGFKRWNIYVYTLIGYKHDTFEKAEARLKQVKDLGITPFAMLYRDDAGNYDKEWRKLQRLWLRPAIMFATGGD